MRETLEVLYLGGVFDGQAFCGVREAIRAVTDGASLVLDLGAVRACEPLALGALLGLMGRLEGTVQLRGFGGPAPSARGEVLRRSDG